MHPKSMTKSTSSKDYLSTDHLSYGLKTKALRGAAVSILSQATIFCIQTVGTIIMARLLTPDDFGLVTMVLTVGLLLGNIGENGFPEAIIQAKEINQKQISTLFWINCLISVLLAAVFIGSSFFIAWFYNEQRVKSIIVAIAFANLIGGLSVIHMAILKRNIQFKRISANYLIAAIVSNTIPIFLAWMGWGYWALVAKWVLAALVLTVGAWVICGWRPGLPVRDSGVGSMVRYAFHTFGNFLMNYFRRNIDKIIIGRSYGSQPLGYYDRAYHLSGILSHQIIYPIYNVAVSTFSRLTDDPEKYRNNFLKVLSILAFIGMPLSAVLSLVSRDAIVLILGRKWEESARIFFAFSLSVGISIVYIAHGWLHLSLGTPDRWFRWGVLELIVTVMFVMIGLPYGGFGVAVAYSISIYIMIGPAFWYAGRPIHLKLSSVLSSLWKYYASALAAGAICWFILNKQEAASNIFIHMNIFNRIMISASLCLSLYLIFVVALYQSVSPIGQFVSVLREIVGDKFRTRKS